jgi:hypothetical protein
MLRNRLLGKLGYTFKKWENNGSEKKIYTNSMKLGKKNKETNPSQL